MTAKITRPRGKKEWPRVVTVGSVAVKIYQVKHATNAAGVAYVVAWGAVDGRKTKKFASLAAAEEEARTKAGQIATGRSEGAEMSRTDRDELQEARRIAGTSGVLPALQEWARARDVTGGNVLPAAEAWAAKNSTRFERIAVKDAIHKFTAAKKRAGVDVTCSYNKILPSLEEHAGDRMLDTLSARGLQSWLDTRYPHPVSRNTARKRIVALFRWCRKQGYLARDAMTEAEQTEFAREEDTVIGVINADTFRALLNHFAAHHPEYLGPLAIADFDGLRRSGGHEQQWADVNIERAFLRVSKAKRNTPSRRLVPLAPAAIEWFMLCQERKGAVCSNLAIDRIREIARAAKNDKGEPLFADLPDNAFRHSRISHRIAATGDVAATALESGNSPAVIFKHYRELFTKEEGEAWFAIAPQEAEIIRLKASA